MSVIIPMLSLVTSLLHHALSTSAGRIANPAGQGISFPGDANPSTHVMFIYNGMMAFIHKFFGRISHFLE
jgi:hypothetical protein